MYKTLWRMVVCVGLACLIMAPASQAQKYESVPVDLSDFWNADGWYHDDADDPTVGTTHGSSPGSSWVLDGGSTERIRITTLPATVIPGQVNVTDDGVVAFMLPEMNIGDLDVYYVVGDTIPVPPGNYESVFFAVMSGSGNWPGNVSQWAADVDPDTGEVYDARSEVNSFKPIYSDGEGDWIPVGTVNDWFWKVPEWVAPESGDPSEIVLEYLAYEGDVNGPIYFWDAVNQSNHDYGQYTYVNGEGFFTYYLDGLTGLTEATLWTEFWGNAKVSISTDDVEYTQIFDTTQEDPLFTPQVYTAPAGNLDGYFPNRGLRSFDLAPYISSGDVEEIFVKFEDAAPDNAAGEENNPWGARLRSIGIFTGPVVVSALGTRLWPGLVRADGASPQGGLILIYKRYFLDESRTLEAITMPNNIPRKSPILSVFAITLSTGESETAVSDFMLF